MIDHGGVPAVVSRSSYVISSHLTVLSKLFGLISDRGRKLLSLTTIDTLIIVLGNLRALVTGTTPILVALVFGMMLIGTLICASTELLFLLAASSLIRVVLWLW